MTAIADLPDIRPSLLLDFANSGRVDPRIECTRASAATCFGPDGKLRVVPANTPRIDYDPATGKCLGLLVEEARTNLAYPSNMPTSTVQTTTGVMQANGGTKITSGVLAPDGAYTGFTVSGADTNVNANGNNNIRAIGALPKIGNYAISFWIKTKAGSPSANVIVRVPTATGTSPQFSTTETWKRISLVATTTAGNDGVIIYSWGGVAFDMWGLQIEEGSFPTSYIPTEGTAVTRAADVLQMQGRTLAAWFNQTEGSILVAAKLNSATQFGYIFGLNRGSGMSSVDGIAVYIERNAIIARVRDIDKSDVSSISSYGISNTSELYKIAIYYDGVSAASSLNGSAPISALRSVPSISTFGLGVRGNSNSLVFNGYIYQFMYYPKKLTDAQIQRLTA